MQVSSPAELDGNNLLFYWSGSQLTEHILQISIGHFLSSCFPFTTVKGVSALFPVRV